MTKVWFAAVCCAVLCGASGSAQGPAEPRLVITEKNDTYELSLAVSRLAVMIPKQRFVSSAQRQGSQSSRYFSFEDRAAGLVVSGWFEPETAFRGMEAFWAGEQRGLTQNGFQIQNIVSEKSDAWQTVLYDIAVPGGRSSNMRAERVQAGTWIDLHLSLTSGGSERENRAALRKLLEAIRVEERPASAAN